jgi:hypothetical protein
MHAIVEVNVGHARAIPLDEGARAGARKTMASLVANRVVGFRFNDEPGAGSPIQFAANKVTRAA